MTSAQANHSIMRRKDVETKTGLRRSTIYARMQAGTFPQSVRLGENSVGWIEAEIDAWIAARIHESRSAA